MLYICASHVFTSSKLEFSGYGTFYLGLERCIKLDIHLSNHPIVRTLFPDLSVLSLRACPSLSQGQTSHSYK